MEETPTAIDAAIENRNESFVELLFTLIDKKNLTDSEVYKAANVSRKTFSDIRNGLIPKKSPSSNLFLRLSCR